MKIDRSFFAYLHDDLSGDPLYKKFGKTMTPYSAVRVRQRYCSKKFSLNHLWFGHPSDINELEIFFKEKFYEYTGTYLTGISAQSELFRLSESFMVSEITNLISKWNLKIKKIELDEPYSAANSSECPIGIPGEKNSYSFLMNKINQTWGKQSLFDIPAKNRLMFGSLFDIKGKDNE